MSTWAAATASTAWRIVVEGMRRYLETGAFYSAVSRPKLDESNSLGVLSTRAEERLS
jgi:hypothetical protein